MGISVLSPLLFTASDVTTALGYTPANKAGDTFSGSITLNTGQFLGPDGSATAPTFAFAGATQTGFYRDSGGGRIRVAVGGTYTGINFANSGTLGLNDDSATIQMGASSDVILARTGANSLSLRNGVNSQTLSIFNTYTDGTNYERGIISWSGNVFRIGTDNVGTGVGRDLRFQTNATSRWTIDGLNGHFFAVTDNTYDFGASGSGRVRSIYAGTNIIAGGSITGASLISTGQVIVNSTNSLSWGNLNSKISSGADGILTLLNNAGTGFSILQFGGTTSTFPALSRTGQQLNAYLADNSGYTDFGANNFVSNSGVFQFVGKGRITAPSDGVITLLNSTLADFARLQFGGTSSAFPALKRSTNTLQVRLADDSDYAPLNTGPLTIANGYDATYTGNLYGSSSRHKILGGFIGDIHPESAKPLTLPFLSNDLAYLTLRGGTCTTTNTIDCPNGFAAWFDGQPTYGQFNRANNPVGGIVITVNLPAGSTFNFGTQLGIHFGNTSWSPTSIKLEVFSVTSGAWVTVDNVTGWTTAAFEVQYGSDANGINAIRWTLDNFNTSTCRIAQIYALNYSSSYGKMIFLGRDGGAMYGNITWGTDNTWDIGANGANRPRSLYLADSAYAGSAGRLGFASRGRISASADGIFTLFNNSESDFGRLNFGGSTSAFPALKRSGTLLQARLADDSGFAQFSSGGLYLSSNTHISAPVSGNLLLADSATDTVFSLLQLGGTTSAYPAIKRSGTTLSFKLADDSDFTDINIRAMVTTGAVTTGGLVKISPYIAGGNNDYLQLRPTDTTTGKPYLYMKSTASLTDFNIGLWDGTANTGTITLSAATIAISNALTVSSGLTLSGGNITIPAANGYVFSGSSIIKAPADGQINLLNNAGSGFTQLNLGLATASFPGFRVNGTQVQVKLGDNSAFTNLQALSYKLSNGTTINDTSDGVLQVTNAATTGLTAIRMGASSGTGVLLKSSTNGLLAVRTVNDGADANLSVQDLTVNGNLTVNGTTTTVNTTNLAVTDAIITVAQGDTTNVINYKGIKAERGTTDQFWVWDEANSAWSGMSSAADPPTSPTLAALRIGAITSATITSSKTITTTDDLNIDGPNFVSNTSTKSTSELAFAAQRSGITQGGVGINGAYLLYNSATLWDSTFANFERGTIKWSSNSLYIGTESTGTGVARPLILGIGGASVWNIGTGTSTYTGSILQVGTTSSAIFQLLDTGGTARHALARSTGTANALIVGDGVNLGAKVGIGHAIGDSLTDTLDVSGTIKHTGLTMSAGTSVDQLYTATQSLTITTAWQDTGINAATLATGTYVVQVLANDSAVGGGEVNTYYSGVMSWFGTDTNETTSDEIALHRAGNSSGAGIIYLRIQRTVTADANDLKLQIAGSTTNSGASNYVFKFRRMI